MNISEVKFGEILKRERKNRKMSLRELNEKSNIEASYIHRLEKGNRDNPGFTTVCALAHALNLDGNEVLNSFGYENLGKKEDIRVNETAISFITKELEELINAYLVSSDHSVGHMPRIISMLEEMKQSTQK